MNVTGLLGLDPQWQALLMQQMEQSQALGQPGQAMPIPQQQQPMQQPMQQQPMQPQPQQPQQPAKSGGILTRMGDALIGMGDPYGMTDKGSLSPEQRQQMIGQTLMQLGTGISSSTARSPFAAIGQGFQYAQHQGQQQGDARMRGELFRQQIDERRRKAAVAQKMKEAIASGDSRAILAAQAEANPESTGSYVLGRQDRIADRTDERSWQEKMENDRRRWEAANRAAPNPIPALDRETGLTTFVHPSQLAANPGRYAPPSTNNFTIGPPAAPFQSPGGANNGGAQPIPQPPQGGAGQPAPQPQRAPGEGFIYENGLPKILPGGAGLYRNADGSIVPKPLDPNAPNPDSPKLEKELRSEYTKLTEAHEEAANGYRTLQGNAASASPAGDIAMVYNFFRVLEPGGRVTESEFSTMGSRGSLPQRVQQFFNAATQGTGLTPEMRADVLRQAEVAYKSREMAYKQQEKYFADVAKRLGVDPRNVIIPRTTVGTDAPPSQGGQGGQGPEQAAAIQAAREAIARGAPPEAVRQRLQQMGIDPSVLGN